MHFERQLDMQCWVHAFNMTVGRPIFTVPQAYAAARTLGRNHTVSFAPDGNYSDNTFTAVAAGAGYQVQRIHFNASSPLASTTFRITPPPGVGSPSAEQLGLPSGDCLSFILTDARHATALRQINGLWYHLDSEGVGPVPSATRRLGPASPGAAMPSLLAPLQTSQRITPSRTTKPTSTHQCLARPPWHTAPPPPPRPCRQSLRLAW